jgi:protein-S-isoprenylcysteine O-methyltransferase Ste14
MVAVELLTPHGIASTIIALCWLAFVVVWMVTALFVKRTVERSLSWARPFALVALIFIAATLRMTVMRQPLWHASALVGALASVVTVAGLVVAVWARLTLGANWSGTITFKEGHELIQRGPYAYVRHPIYSGLLLMGLGTAIESARPSTFLFVAASTVMMMIKAHHEERLMSRHFPAYDEYRRRVKALIPGVW